MRSLFVIVPLLVLFKSEGILAQFTTATVVQHERHFPLEETDTTRALEINSFAYEIAAAYVHDYVALGLNVRAHLFDRFSIGVKLTINPGDGSLFTVPYFQVAWPELGGFEIGSLIRPSVTEWTVPYWESWRVWIGREREVMLVASVLSNVPLNAIGYYDAGIGIGIGERDHRLWFGVASLDDRKQSKGLACKTQWDIGPHTWLTTNASFMIAPRQGAKTFSVSAGVRQEF